MVSKADRIFAVKCVFTTPRPLSEEALFSLHKGSSPSERPAFVTVLEPCRYEISVDARISGWEDATYAADPVQARVRVVVGEDGLNEGMVDVVSVFSVLKPG